MGGGARTIEISPSGNFVFAACNAASEVCVVDTRSMQMIAQIPCDSYPVGLDISRDGQWVIVTSQGRKNGGGNAVNVYKVEYATPEPNMNDSIPAQVTQPDALDSLSLDESATSTSGTAVPLWKTPWAIAAAAAILLLLLLLLLIRLFRKK